MYGAEVTILDVYGRERDITKTSEGEMVNGLCFDSFEWVFSFTARP